MRVIDILQSPWAILPDKKLEIDAIYLTHLRGEKIDIKGVEAAMGRPLNNAPQGYSVINGVAVLPIEGVVAKRMNLFTHISGGVSSTMLQQELAKALEDPSVQAIILQIDSPGGAVDGTQELANAVFQARGKKPIVALADGCACSAAYWVAAAADQVFAASDTTMVGSIGVVTSHVDVSAAEAQRGIRTTEITAGRFKRIASQYAPLSPEGRASIQGQLDHIYGVFVDAVGQYRGGIDASVVHETMADGRVFLGQQAVDAGLVDGIATLDQLISQLTQDGTTAGLARKPGAVSPGTSTIATSAGAAEPTPTPEKENPMLNLEKLKADHPDLFQAAVDAGKAEALAGMAQELKDAEAKGATAERQRIQDVLAQNLPGHDALVRSLAFDGTTTGPEAAMKVLEAEKAKRGANLEALRADAPNAVEPTATTESTPAPKNAAAEAHVLAGRIAAYVQEQAAQGVTVSYAEALNHVKKQEA